MKLIVLLVFITNSKWARLNGPSCYLEIFLYAINIINVIKKDDNI